MAKHKVRFLQSTALPQSSFNDITFLFSAHSLVFFQSSRSSSDSRASGGVGAESGRFPAHSHAEVQVNGHVELKLSPDEQPYPYFGVSKLSYWLCHEFLATYGSRNNRHKLGQYRTRGCHGTLHPKWDVGVLRRSDNEYLKKCLAAISAKMDKKLLATLNRNRDGVMQRVLRVSFQIKGGEKIAIPCPADLPALLDILSPSQYTVSQAPAALNLRELPFAKAAKRTLRKRP
jgi:hypothetical protein